ncbi:MAG: two-component regulator propeller domain-containing protein, partial [Lewinella sp.]
MLRLLLSMLLLAAVALRAGPTLVFDHYTVGDGLTHNTVHTLHQDRNGYLWIGTRYGLDRFDGSRFRSYPPVGDSLRANAVFSLLEDEDGSMWVGYRDGGLGIIPPGGTRGIPFRLGPDGRTPVDWSTITVRGLFRDSRGWTWIATYGGGVVVLDERRQYRAHLRTYNDPGPGERISDDFVFDFAESPAGDIYLATAGNRIDVWRQASDSVEILKPPDNHPLQSFAKALVYGPDGSLWIGTSGSGLSHYGPDGSWRHFGGDSGLSSDMVTDLIFGPDGRLWIATDGGGLDVLNPVTFTVKKHRHDAARNSSLNSDALYSLLFDQAGNLWAGTFNGGLNVHRPVATPYVTDRRYSAERLAGLGSVLSAAQDSSGIVWLGTDGSGLFRFRTDSPGVEVLPFANVLSGTPVPGQAEAGGVITCLQPVGDSGLWYGSYAGGLTYLNLNSGQQTKYVPRAGDPTSLGHENVWDLALDLDGGLWVGLLGGGLDYLPPGGTTFRHYGAGPDQLTDLQVVNILPDRDGRHIWIATERSGLNRLDRETGAIRQFRESPGALPTDRLRTLYQDKSGVLWIGTEDSGLVAYVSATDSFKAYSTTTGLPFDRVSGILEAGNGTFWVSGITDLYQWNPLSGTTTAFQPEPDLGYNLWNAGAAVALSDGRLLFGGVNGFSLLDPESVAAVAASPAAWISDLFVNNERVPTGAPLEISHRDRGIRFQLATADLRRPEAIRYAYRLRGYRQEWTDLPPGTDNLIFSALPGGDYDLELRTVAADGSPGPVTRPFPVIVTPPFWERGWFAGLLLLLLVAGFYSFNAYLLRQQRAEHR